MITNKNPSSPQNKHKAFQKIKLNLKGLSFMALACEMGFIKGSKMQSGYRKGANFHPI